MKIILSKDLLVVFGYPSLIMQTSFILWKWCIWRKPPPSASSISMHLGDGLLGWAIFWWRWTHNLHHERLHTPTTCNKNEYGKAWSEAMEHDRGNKLGHAIWFEDVTSPSTITKVVPLHHLWLRLKFSICFFCNSKRINCTTIGHDRFQQPLHTSDLFYMSRGAQFLSSQIDQGLRKVLGFTKQCSIDKNSWEWFLSCLHRKPHMVLMWWLSRMISPLPSPPLPVSDQVRGKINCMTHNILCVRWITYEWDHKKRILSN